MKICLKNLVMAAATICVVLIPFPSKSQTVDLPIQNILQETEVWCWVAVVQQIVLALHGPQNTPWQCALVERAYNAPPWTCCNRVGSFNGNPQCRKGGQIPQIQGLLGQFGGVPSSYNPPADPMVLFNTLQSGRAIILELQSTPFSGHVVVLRGMSWVGGVPVLHINDPMAHFTQPVPFANLMGYWQGAIVVN